jgi:cytoskeletal protein CcmA (bactofilin family)
MRSRLRLTRPGAWIILLAILLALAPQPALAADIRGNDFVVIDAGTVIEDDLYVFGNTVDIRGTVNGDVIAGASTVTVSGTVTGDLIAAAGTILVPGHVQGSIRATGGNLSITGSVLGDVLVGGGSLEVGPQAEVGRDLLFGGGTLALNGRVARNVQVGGGDATVGGHVAGDLRTDVGKLTIADSAVIQGDLTYAADRVATIASGATIAGQTQRHATPDAAEPTLTDQVVSHAVNGIRMLVAMLLVGLSLVLLFPTFSRHASDSLRRAPWPSVGIGLALLFGVPILAVTVLIAGIFIGGWWLAPILVGVYAAALVVGYIVVGLLVGRAILHQIGFRNPHQAVAVLTGLAILTLIGMAPVLGWFVGLVAAAAGLGALALVIWQVGRHEPTVAPA